MPSGAVHPNNLALARDCPPLRQRGGASLFVDFAADEVAFLTEVVVDGGVEFAVTAREVNMR